MNIPPTEYRRIPVEPLRRFTRDVFQRLGLGPEDAALLAELLVANDLRGIFSHGTRQLQGYVRQFQAGHLNPSPALRERVTGPATLVVDGDGGLGYFPALRAIRAAVHRCREHGLAAAVTRNHGHVGAAGIYARIAVGEGLAAWVTSGHELELRPEHSLAAAAGGPPICFAIPTGREAPFVLDFGAMTDVRPEALMASAPALALRCIGLGVVCQSLSGFMAGLPADPERVARRFPGANHGGFFFVLDPDRFLAVDEFRREMAAYVERVHQLQPLPGLDRPLLPGEPEWEREREWARIGIPIGPEHEAQLAAIAGELAIPAPGPEDASPD